MRTKDEFHKLIDNIEDEEVLKSYYELINRLSLHETGNLWNDLTVEEKKESMVSYEESFDQLNLISHEQEKKQHDKWLKKYPDIEG